ncbi:hypothetical protein CO683_41470 [Bradyrhizobium ottawaense]|uniref:N-formylglutamate amidohydrolase n=1 Tax=Bradyrhizobium TaxID=374 RepID=UPI000BE95C7E|nr:MULTISPECIES: N-formylglutamate amidohydrolase [Bradyrhizobium]PDT63942.1 hypothetical protein CO683_41470 [Bradyrhizobium ottawaense]
MASSRGCQIWESRALRRHTVDTCRFKSRSRRAAIGPFQDAVISVSMFDGTSIYQERPDPTTLSQRLAEYHLPYHQALSDIIRRLRKLCGRVLLLDLHAFLRTHRRRCMNRRLAGASCQPATTAIAVIAFERRGFRAVSNEPFAGGRKHYSASSKALQIELRFTTYMDCGRIDDPVRPEIDNARLQFLKPRLRGALTEMVDRWCPI